METWFYQMCPLTLNAGQQSTVSLILLTLYNSIEHPQDYVPLQLIISGMERAVKSYIIKCTQRLVR